MQQPACFGRPALEQPAFFSRPALQQPAFFSRPALHSSPPFSVGRPCSSPARLFQSAGPAAARCCSPPYALLQYNAAYDVAVSSDASGMIEYWGGRDQE